MTRPVVGGYEVNRGEGAVLYAPEEYERAHNRPLSERTPIPAVGDEVLYRHHEGSPRLYRAQVVEVQSLDDVADDNLWRFTTDRGMQPLTLEGRRVRAQALDPWPMVRLELIEPIVEDHLRAGWLIETREARMRGAAGWLPLDWQTRPQAAAPSILIARR